MTKSVKPPVELKKKVFSKAQQKSPNFARGLGAEQIALDFLLQHNYRCLARNVSLGKLELDLVMLDQSFDEIVFVEVKYRRSDQAGEGSNSVDQRKLAKLERVAQAYLCKLDYQKAYRFDIISVVGQLSKPEIYHFENITWL